jgi:hypothetical protein
MLGIWKSNGMMLNYTGIQNGDYVAARYLAEFLKPVLIGGSATEYWKGIYLDSMFDPNTRDVTSPATANSCLPGQTCGAGGMCANSTCTSQSTSDLLTHTEIGPGNNLEKLRQHYVKMLQYLREQYPDAQGGANTADVNLAKSGQMFLTETGNLTFGSFRYPTRAYNAGAGAWDDYAPAANPGCATRQLAAIGDTQSEFTTSDGFWYSWDRSNRGPMTALAAFYIHTNECTDLFYTTSGANLYLGSDDYTYWNAVPEFTLTQDLQADTASGVKYVYANFGSWAGGEAVKIGTTGEYLSLTRVSGDVAPYSRMQTTEAVRFTYPAGSTSVWRLFKSNLGYEAMPPLSQIYSFGLYFPAMDIDVGVPDVVNGLPGDGGARGARKFVWKTYAESGTKQGIARRDFTKAIVLWGNSDFTVPVSLGGNPVSGSATRAHFTTYSPAYQIDINGAPITFYPLRADGRTDNAICNYGPGDDYRTADGGCSRIRVRSAEGMVLMKEPVY